MSLFKERESQKWRKIASFILLIIVFLLLLNSVYKVYNKKRKIDSALAQSRDELRELQERENQLIGLKDRINTRDGLEYELRKKFGVAKVDESVVIIVDKQNKGDTDATSESLWEKIKNFWYSIF